TPRGPAPVVPGMQPAPARATEAAPERARRTHSQPAAAAWLRPVGRVGGQCTPEAGSGLMPAPTDDPCAGAALAPSAWGPSPRAAAVRPPVPGDLRVPRRAGRARRALPRPLQRVAAPVRRHVAVPGRGRDGGTLRPRRAPAAARAADLETRRATL